MNGKRCVSHTNASNFRRPLQSLLLKYTAENLFSYISCETSYCDVIVVKKFTLLSIRETSGSFFNAASVIVSSTMRGRTDDSQRKEFAY